MRFEQLSVYIESEYNKMHDNRASWNSLYGQWLVYGFEKYIGFYSAVNLCAAIESAHKKKLNIKTEARKFFEDYNNEYNISK
jgi:hypothetical protein